MNRKLVVRLLGAILLIEAATMVPSLLVSFIYKDGDSMALAATIGILIVLGLPPWLLIKPGEKNLRAREGFVTVSLSWVLLCVFGALPYIFSGVITNWVDALFESVSGFTTTGATVIPWLEDVPRGVMFWRCFTHWIGGMGVLVFTLALLPKMTGRTTHLARAESPGPVLSKIVPKMGDSAKILYIIYGCMTLIAFLSLLAAGMSVYDAALHAMSTAGTGGFSNHMASIGAYNNVAIEVVITIFMVVFGINLALFYRILTGGWRDALKSEELRWFLGIFFGAVLVISLLITPQYGNFFTALRYGSFQVASIISTTGFATADYTQWHQAAQMLLVVLLFIGSCAGSTAGGLKVVRVALLCKLGRREIRHTFQPRKVQVVRFEGKGVEEGMLAQVATFFFVYILILLSGTFLVSLEGKFDFATHFSAALTSMSNVGPGLSVISPAGNFAGFGPFSKIVLCVLMLCGRLELFPILVLFHPAIWRKA